MGANERSRIPNGTFNLLDASFPTSCPTLVTLNAVFLIVSHNSSKLDPLQFSIAVFTTPGPLTPTLMTASPSLTPWNAPAMNGLSSGGLQNTTSLAHPMESLSFVASAVFLTMSPIILTTSMLIPILVEPSPMELQTLFVVANAFGMDSMSILSALVMFFIGRAENPPMKLIPIFVAALSNVLAMDTKSSGVSQAAPPISDIGVTDTLLFTIGMPYSRPISSPTDTRFFARVVILA